MVSPNRGMSPRFFLYAGINLLEVVLGMVIMVVTLIPLFGIMSKDVQDQDVAAANTYAMELGASVMDYYLEVVPFEAIFSKGGDKPCVVKAQADAQFQSKNRQTGAPNDEAMVDTIMTKLLKNPYWTPDHNQQEFSPKKEDGGFLSQWFKGDLRGITYKVTVTAIDFKDSDGSKFEGSSKSDTAGWKELYFDSYETPDFEYQKDWNKVQMSATLAGKGALSPYTYAGKKGWGELQRGSSGLKFGIDYPKDQGDVSEVIPGWGYFCTMKKIIVEIQWNMSPAYYHKPDDLTGPGSRPNRMHFMSYKGDLFR